jgi:MFS family permease
VRRRRAGRCGGGASNSESSAVETKRWGRRPPWSTRPDFTLPDHCLALFGMLRRASSRVVPILPLVRNVMIRAIAPVLTLLISTALLLMGNGLQGTLLPVRGELEGFSPMALGILGSSYFVGFAAGCFGGPRVIARAGHVRAFAAAVAIASAVVLAHAVTMNPAVWWILRAITGACFATLFMIIESWLNEKSTNEDRGLVFSLYTIIQLTVITLGQLMLMTAEPEDFPLFSVASILISLSAVPLALTRASVPEPIEATRIDFRRLYQASPIGVVGCLIVGLTNGCFWSLAPLFVQSGGGEAGDVAIFMSATVIGGAIGQWPLGRLSDRIDRRRVIQAAGLGAAIAGASLAWFIESSTTMVLASGVAYGVFAFPLYAISVAHTNDFVAPEGYVQAASGLLLVFALGAVVGPVAASALIANWGAESLFLLTAAIHATFVLYVTARMPLRKRPVEDDRIAFSESILVSTTTSTVDPLMLDPQETTAPDSKD